MFSQSYHFDKDVQLFKIRDTVAFDSDSSCELISDQSCTRVIQSKDPNQSSKQDEIKECHQEHDALESPHSSWNKGLLHVFTDDMRFESRVQEEENIIPIFAQLSIKRHEVKVVFRRARIVNV
jgi:hypothetical protein